MIGTPYKCFVRAFIDADCIFAAKYMKSNPDGYKILSSDKVQVTNNINLELCSTIYLPSATCIDNGILSLVLEDIWILKCENLKTFCDNYSM